MEEQKQDMVQEQKQDVTEEQKQDVVEEQKTENRSAKLEHSPDMEPAWHKPIAPVTYSHGHDDDQRDRSESLSAPRLPRMSFTEAPPELAALDLDPVQLPPMNPEAAPSRNLYSLKQLLFATETLPPVKELRPLQMPDGTVKPNPMRDRPRYEPLSPDTPPRFETLLSMREGAHGKFTADFMQLSASDWDPDMEEDYHTYSFGHGVDRLPVLEETELHSAFALKGIAIEENEMSSSSLPNDDLPEAVKAAATSQLDVPSEKASGAGPQGQPQAVELGQEWWRRYGFLGRPPPPNLVAPQVRRGLPHGPPTITNGSKGRYRAVCPGSAIFRLAHLKNQRSPLTPGRAGRWEDTRPSMLASFLRILAVEKVLFSIQSSFPGFDLTVADASKLQTEVVTEISPSESSAYRQSVLESSSSWSRVRMK
ncbi:hypothetical protein GUITHDRAFT_118699 [Guillardia theta CCMP2712]|uniref:Uncharacterized protein n=1 Tax=Guillardia theta (strain CCMP2712) TaxID=905079 RepID=L1IFV6_GUITC|nr:hypothetical protein GUITHDRAFT_118699 [Guillardia theta CCMP2712]EKX35151.1 hypothetical protein GUITHDRAFT_118699 [Guillardia theta CCMP2712]|eukprot:XP_005822131.1 hypothetical protein GUITHDRAFT_118699 [Guillardia theta CCMP2712]